MATGRTAALAVPTRAGTGYTPGMSDADPTPPPGETPPTTAAPAATPPPRRRRRWVRTVLLLAVLLVLGLVLLVALAPTLLSTRPAVNFALGKVNAKLNGRVEVGSVSLGWTTGVRIDGLRVFDDAHVQIAQAEHVVCPMPLYKAISGSYPLGHTVVDGLAFDAKYDAQGRLNFARLVKSQPGPPSSPSPTPSTPAKPSSSPSEPAKLPDVSGDLELTNARGTVSQPGKPTLYLTALAARVQIPSVNQPITDHVDAKFKAADGPDGHLVLDGTVAAVANNRLSLDTAAVHQTGDLTGLDLAAAKPFVAATAGLDTLAGMLDGHLLLDVVGGKSATLDANLTATQKVTVGGRVLSGDTFTTNTLAAAVPKLTATFPDGLGHWPTGRIKVGADAGSAPISFKLDQGQLTLAADVVPQSLLNLRAGHAPGTDGKVDFASHFDAAAIVGQLKHTSRLADDVTLNSGALDQSLALALSADKGTVTAHTGLTNVAGTRGGKPVAVQPINLDLAAADVGGANPVDGLRDLSLKLNSKFANGEFHGTTVGDLTGTLTAQLQAMQAEFEQFVDFKGTTLAGDLAVRVDDSGQLTAAPFQAKVKAAVRLTDLRYGNKDGPVVAEPLVGVNVTGDLQGSEKSIVEQAKNLVVTVNAGTAESPTVDLAVAVPLVTLADRSADFQLTRLNVNLPLLQRQFANVPPGKVGTLCTAGTLTGTAGGHYGVDGFRLDPSKLSLAHLTVQRQLADGTRVSVVADDTVTLSAAGTATLGKVKTVDVTDLVLADSAHIFDVHKGDGVLTFTKTDDAVSGRGLVEVMAEVGSLVDIGRAMTQTTAVPAASKVGIRSGHLSGNVAFKDLGDGKTDIAGHLAVPNLDIATPGGDPGPQMASVILQGSADRATHQVTLANLSFQSPFAVATVSDAVVLLSGKTTPDQLQHATLDVNVPMLKVIAAIAQSFSAPPPPAKAGEPAPLAPLRITAGSFRLKADVSHDGSDVVLNVPTLEATNVAFVRGTETYTAKPIAAHLAARVGTGTGAKLMEQLRGLKVTQLDADAGIVTLALSSPVSVPDLSRPGSASGGVKVDGDVGELAHLAAAYAGKPATAYPYRGHLTATQTLAGDADTVAVRGSATVAGFQVMQGAQPSFTEDQLVVTDDVSAPADLSAVAIKTVGVDMHSSGALTLAINNGTVDDLPHDRRLNLPVALNYDLAKLWPVVHPMLVKPGEKDAYADVKVTGQFSRPALIAGSYPAGLPFTEAVKTLKVDCGLAVASLEHGGLSVQNLDVPVTVRDGKAVTTDSAGNTAGPATANGGQLDLGHVTVDLTTEVPRVSTPANKVLLTHATINPLFSDTFLNAVINNPVFVGTKDATGLLDVTIVRCDRLPAGMLVKQAVPANDGSATIKFSLTELNVGSQGLGASLGKVMQAINKDNNEASQPDAFKANVKDATVTLAHGVATQDITFQTGRYNVRFAGSVALASEQMQPMTIGVPGSAIARIFTSDPNVLKAVPASADVPLTGKLSDPHSYAVPWDRVGQDLVTKAAPNAIGSLLGDKLGGNKGGDKAAPTNPADVLGGLLGGNKKDDADKPKPPPGNRPADKGKGKPKKK